MALKAPAIWLQAPSTACFRAGSVMLADMALAIIMFFLRDSSTSASAASAAALMVEKRRHSLSGGKKGEI